MEYHTIFMGEVTAQGYVWVERQTPYDDKVLICQIDEYGKYTSWYAPVEEFHKLIADAAQGIRKHDKESAKYLSKRL